MTGLRLPPYKRGVKPGGPEPSPCYTRATSHGLGRSAAVSHSLRLSCKALRRPGSSIAPGHSNRQIARDLAIGEQTVKTHVRSILAKLGLQDRVQAATFALRHQADSPEHRP
jgi:Bacterial regulatory proteins, luxR family